MKVSRRTLLSRGATTVMGMGASAILGQGGIDAASSPPNPDSTPNDRKKKGPFHVPDVSTVPVVVSTTSGGPGGGADVQLGSAWVDHGEGQLITRGTAPAVKQPFLVYQLGLYPPLQTETGQGPGESNTPSGGPSEEAGPAAPVTRGRNAEASSNPAADAPKHRLLSYGMVEPKLSTPDATAPDVMVRVGLLAFHVANSERVTRDSKAAVQLCLGQSQLATRQTQFEKVMWTAQAALQLWTQPNGTQVNVAPATNQSTGSTQNLTDAFSGRPVEIPGAQGQLMFTVVAHRDPTWWQQILGAAQSVVSVVGFPAMALKSLNLVNSLSNQFQGSTKTLFESQMQHFAFSKEASEAIDPDGQRKLAVLNPGLWVIARQGDFDNAEAIYDPNFGILVKPEQPAGDSTDPFPDKTYAVIQAEVAPYKLDPTYGFSGTNAAPAPGGGQSPAGTGGGSASGNGGSVTGGAATGGGIGGGTGKRTGSKNSGHTGGAKTGGNTRGSGGG